MSDLEFTRVPTLPLIADAVAADIGRVAVQKCFDSIGISRETLSRPGAVLPMRDLFGLFELFARKRGDDAFGLFAGNALQPASFGLFIRFAAQGPTLAAAIDRGNRGLRLHQVCSTFALTADNAFVKWSYTVDLPLSFGRHHHAVHVLLLMRSFVTTFLGHLPRIMEIGLEANEYGSSGGLEEVFAAPARWGQRANYLLFPRDLLLTPRKPTLDPEEPITFGDLRRYALGHPPRTASERVRAAIQLRGNDARTSLDDVARYLNVGARTLQRQLSRESSTFKMISETAQKIRARELIKETDLPMKQISRLIGYTDAAHFTRAYRGWYGIAPSQDRISSKSAAI
ncbi:Helix-turn-helix domain-containing protein [Bauldia litoralis]|uniref:Helix-turn-helix domain-containing protein n=1 Tax=Bauldia litoralis TaxID=665467 RepID=A0A1G6B064_9HYPH|nr:Helix-turn-helix domain-containing protein [Bauldia litoralis]